MIKDRLAEFRTIDSNSSDSNSNSISEEEYELIPTSSQAFSGFVREILPEVDEIQKTIEEWHVEQKAIISRKMVQKHEKEDLEARCLLVRKQLRLVKPSIDEMHLKFQEMKRNSSKQIEIKMIENQYAFVLKLLRDAVELKSCLEVEYKNKIANWFDDELMKPSQHEIVQESYWVELEKPIIEVVDETELQTINETKPLWRAKSINKALREIKKRNDDILEVEQKTKLLHEMMEDLEYVVHTQGEIGNRVEKHTEITKIVMEKVEIQTDQAIVSRKAANNKLCAVMALVLCLFLLFVILNLARLF
ncbi:unnamed protein product, partial [Mesorhabditis belari]|uniref:t-SNARE coiled-coil homology domain-containing protein n=1 Tax=Mesorhabditis belari TaxID=2138241 RepID=A0AAF3FNN2_9BILA